MILKTSVQGPYVEIAISGVLSSADLAVLFATLDSARLNGPFVVLTDATAMTSAPRPVVSQFVADLKTRPPMTDRWLADAVVVSSPGIRFVLSTVVMLAPMPLAVRAFEHRTEAVRWCTAELEKAGIAPPPMLLSATR